MINSFDVLFACPQPVLIFSTDLKIVEANDAAAVFFERSREDLLQLSVADLHSPAENTTVMAETKERKVVRNKSTSFSTASGLKRTQVSSYPASFNGQEARVKLITEVKAEPLTLPWKHLYSRLIKTLEVIPVGFYLLDRDWKVTYWNKKAEQIFGLQRGSVLGSNLWELFPEAIDSRFYSEYCRAMEMRTPVEFEEYFWPLQMWGKLNVQPLDEGLAVFFQDVTPYLTAEEALKENIEELKEVAFIHSHLIRRPVANILALSTLLSSNTESDGSEVKKLIASSSTELDHIITKTNQMVNRQEGLTKTVMNRTIEDVSVRELLEGIALRMQESYKDHLIELDNKTSIRFLCNPRTIEELLVKTVDNAVKFSSKGSKVILRAEVQQDSLTLSVRDQGIGMDEAMRLKFFQALKNREEAKKLGKGVFRIVQIVQAHNGSAWVEAAPELGTTVYVRFPLSRFSELSKVTDRRQSYRANRKIQRSAS